MKMLSVFAAVFFLMVGTVQAKPTTILTITSDADEYTSYLKLDLDENGDVTKMIKEKYDENGAPMPKEGLVVEVKNIKPGKQIEFATKGSHKVVLLSSPNFSAQTGGTILLDFLKEGALIGKDERWTSKYKLELVREGVEWKLRKNGETVTHLYFVSTRNAVNLAVGIDKVMVNKVRTK